ncbi:MULTISPECIES: hypothetical protein [Mycobacteriaceae]|uniref:hypothetical protein n=1 Tax=Mycobacteriaceae TaxID=1762 RepID=UPI0007FE6C24|nr:MULTISPECIES: hypothetical protein [Mycobacteriaceae]MCK0176025.1 hypothetical protein [Mycolicibacterium sp. F2034L]OBB60532.1 hypothetical protein A5757_08910 [Mycobacterium sp. 852013-51886_SCH5428379]
MTEPHHADDDPRLRALLEWRERLIDSGAVSARSFKEAHLRLVLRSGRTDVDQIRAMLPGSVSEHAEDMARVLTGLPPGPEDSVEPGRHRVADPESVAPAEIAAPTEPAEDAFAPYGAAAAETALHSATLHSVTLHRRRDTGALELRWPPVEQTAVDSGADSEAAVVLYRLVSAEDSPPSSPDEADLIAVTTATSAVDDRAPVAAVRHFQVWVNAGPSHAEAVAAQPILHAAGVLISRVTDLTLREDSGRVIGQYRVPPGVDAVYVYRVPAHEAHRDGPQFRILAGQDNLTGFVDVDVERGHGYVYRVRCAAPVDDVLRLSEPVTGEVAISAVLAPVTDLTITGSSADGTVLDLAWTTPPGGRVVVFRSPTGPAPGTEDAELPEDALDQVGLTPDLLLAQPVSDQQEQDGTIRTAMPAVAWPDGWSRAYFTPVTLIGGQAMLGKTFATVRTGVIRDIELAEYCNKQVLTFDWPDGAASVVVFLAPRGHDPRDGLGHGEWAGQSYEITLEEYERYGGLQLSGQLPVHGCSLHLAPVAFTGGKRVMGAIASVDYQGLLRLQYAVRVGRDPDGRPFSATIAVRSEYDLPGSPAFVLVNNPQRIPLSLHDGELVDVAPLNEQGQLAAAPSKELRWSQLTTTGASELWAANVRNRRGWIRLFVNTSAPESLRLIALLDPPVDHLRLTPVGP